MTLTVLNVQAWRPHDLMSSADGIDAVALRIDESMYGLCLEQDVLAETWGGEAARAAAERVVGESNSAGKVADAIIAVAQQYRTSSGMIAGPYLTQLTIKILVSRHDDLDIDMTVMNLALTIGAR